MQIDTEVHFASHITHPTPDTKQQPDKKHKLKLLI